MPQGKQLELINNCSIKYTVKGNLKTAFILYNSIPTYNMKVFIDQLYAFMGLLNDLF